MTQKFINNFRTTVAATFGTSDTTLQLTTSTGLPVLSGGDFYTLTLFHLDGVVESDHLVLKVTDRTGNVCTVERLEGATGEQFLAGDLVEARASASAFAAKADLDTTNAAIALKANTADVYPKTQTYTQDEINAAITLAINNLVNGAPGALDTLEELAQALGDDPNFATTITTALAGKQANFVTGTNYKVPLLHATTGKFAVRNYADNDDLFTVHNTDGVTVLGSLSIDNFGADATQAINTTAGNYASVSFRTGGVDRWFFGKNNVAESGANAGSDFFLGSFSDGGVFLETVMSFNRATGVGNFSDIPTVASVPLVTTTASQTLTNKTLTTPTLTTPTIDGYTEGSATASGTVFSPDITSDTVFGYSTTGNATTTLPAPAAGKSFEIHITYGGAHTLSWSVSGGTALLWDNGTAPTPTSVNGKTDIFMFRCTKLNGTLQWVGALAYRNF